MGHGFVVSIGPAYPSDPRKTGVGRATSATKKDIRIYLYVATALPFRDPGSARFSRASDASSVEAAATPLRNRGGNVAAPISH